MKNRLILSCIVVLLSVYSCGKGDSNVKGTQHDRKEERANTIDVQGAELNEENRESIKTNLAQVATHK